MTLLVGDKVMLVQDRDGKLIAISAPTPLVGDKVARFNTNTNAISLPLSTPLVGDKVYISPSSSGKNIVIKSGQDKHWILQTSSPGWSARWGHGCVVMSDGSLVLMGGKTGSTTNVNDVWHSEDKGITWHCHSANGVAGWLGRNTFGAVVLSDDTIVIFGGSGYHPTLYYPWDVWKSVDKGVTWTQVIYGPEWSRRDAFGYTVLSDDTIILTGGIYFGTVSPECWASTNKGATWTMILPFPYIAGWGYRYDHAMLAYPDDTILLTAGISWGGTILKDTNKSVDKGVTWELQNYPSALTPINRHSMAYYPTNNSAFIICGVDVPYVWETKDKGATWKKLLDFDGGDRQYHNTVTLPDGTIILTAGVSSLSEYKNDVWRYDP